MLIQFSVTDVDYDRLLLHIDRSTSAYQALLAALLEMARTTWLVTCKPLEGIRILQLAHKVCPDAVDAIRSGLHKFTTSR